MGEKKSLVVGNINKDINLNTFDKVTNIRIDSRVQGKIKFKAPTNLRAIIENTSRRIDEAEKVVDEIIIPEIVQIDYDRTILELNMKHYKGVKND